jgi:hypothetical protein
MAIEIEYTSNSESKIKALGVLKVPTLKEARRSALSSTGFFVSDEMRAFMEKKGDGNWKAAHPLTRIWRKGKNGSWTRFSGYVSPYYGLAKFARYVINTAATQETMGFGTFSGKQVAKGKQPQFDPYLQKLIREAQKGRHPRVTPKMRRKFGAQKEIGKGKIGQDFFPLRKTTSAIHVPARPIAVPVFRKIYNPATTVFKTKFAVALKKRYEKL